MPQSKRKNGQQLFSPLALAQRIGSLLGRQLSLRIVYLSCITGAVAGLGAVLFSWGLDYVSHLSLHTWAGVEIPHPAGETNVFSSGPVNYRPWIFFFLPVLGGG